MKAWGKAVACASSLLLPQSSVWACSVCYGDPDSPLTKGALGGVIVLAALVYVLLMSFVGVGVYWAVRARHISRGPVQPEAAFPAGSSSTHSGS